MDSFEVIQILQLAKNFWFSKFVLLGRKSSGMLQGPSVPFPILKGGSIKEVLG